MGVVMPPSRSSAEPASWLNVLRVMAGIWAGTVLGSLLAEASDRSSNPWGLLVATIILMTVGAFPGVLLYVFLLRRLRVYTRRAAVLCSGVIVLAMLPWTLGAATEPAWAWLLFVVAVPLLAGLAAKLPASSPPSGTSSARG